MGTSDSIFKYKNTFPHPEGKERRRPFLCFSDEGSFAQPVGPVLNTPGSQKTEVEPHPVPVFTTPSVTPAELPNPAPAPLVMPAVNGSKPSDTFAQLDLDGEILGDDLDELLDKVAPPDLPMVNVW